MLIIRVTSFYQQKKENDMAYQHLTAEERSQIYILLSKYYSETFAISSSMNNLCVFLFRQYINYFIF
ncbi:MAG: hypothetical protein HAW62_01770 [Endozoicomonadaceae bacterium]|nr:hypothetical protein [Endozoicomonadaceae bacterium]